MQGRSSTGRNEPENPVRELTFTCIECGTTNSQLFKHTRPTEHIMPCSECGEETRQER